MRSRGRRPLARLRRRPRNFTLNNFVITKISIHVWHKWKQTNVHHKSCSRSFVEKDTGTEVDTVGIGEISTCRQWGSTKCVCRIFYYDFWKMAPQELLYPLLLYPGSAIPTWRAVGPWTASKPTHEYRSNTDIAEVAVTFSADDVTISAASAAMMRISGHVTRWWWWWL